MAESGNSCVVYIFLVIGFILVLLLAILLPISFSSLEYYEMAFVRRKSTGAVDTTKVWEGGKHLIGPDYEFKIYKASAHFEYLSNLAVFTSDNLELVLDVRFQYFIRKEDLKLLHRQYDLYYESVMRTSAIDALKAEAPTFTTRQFVRSRQAVETAMFKAVRERLGGKCCSIDCKRYEFACPKDCKPYTQCQTADKGLFVDVMFFQLGDVNIPNDLKDRYLRALTLQEDAAKELLLQDAQVVRKQTDELIRQKQNEAQEISQNATAQSSLLETISQANYTATIEKARSSGLSILYSKLGITEQEFKNSFDYLRTLKGLDNAHFTVDFQQRIVGNLG